MLRTLLASPGLFLALPAVASAAAFGELPPFATGDDMTCLRATGEPGGLASDRGFTVHTTLLRATPAGLQRADSPVFAPYGSCTELALRPGGAGIATYFYAFEPGDSGVRVLLREGGTWGAPVEPFGDPGQAGLDALAVDISAAGGQGAGRWEVTAIRRVPGGSFGRVETLMRRTGAVGRTWMQAGVTAAGETVVAWSMIPATDAPRELWASIAAPGGAFRAPVRIGSGNGPFALAVGDGGQTLLAFASRKQLLVAERGAGADFGSALPVGAADDPLLVTPAAAVRADGAAVVGWVDDMDGRARAVVRPRPGGFGRPIELARRVPLGIDPVLLDLFLGDDSGLEPEEDAQPLGVTFAPGDRALLAWAATAGRDRVFSVAPAVATVPLAVGAAEVHALGNGLRDVRVITPVVLAGEAPAVAWFEGEAGPIHLAVEGVPDAAGEPPAPRVRFGGPRRRVVGADDAIELPVTCSAACDVRASAGKGAWLTGTGLSLRRAGKGTLRLRPELGPIARLDGAPVPVHVRFGAPGTRRPRSRTVMVRVRRRPSAPLPRVRDVRARRDGADIVVTWRTERRADKDSFLAYASRQPRANALGGADATGSGRRFRATIRDVATARYVTVLAGSEHSGLIRRTTVEIKR